MKKTDKIADSFIARRLLVDRITGSLTGQVEDLRKLASLGQARIENPGLRAFLQTLDRDIDEDTGMATLFARIGALTNQRCKRKLVENLIFNWCIKGRGIRSRLASRNIWAPTLVVISPTMGCNLRCTGCYSGLYSKDGELSEEEIDGILAECRRIGVYFVVVSGGEPYIMKDVWLRLFKKYNDMYFLTYTNGTLLDEQTVRALARLGNVAPAISVEGFEEHTDRRRGAGVYGKVVKAMDLLKAEGVIFGISVTYTRENIDLITTNEFVQYYIKKGAVFAWYFMFMPVGKDPILELVPTPEQRVFCGDRVAELRKKHPLFMADFWNDGPAVGGCLAGGRHYLHILNSGRIEPCVFAHFGVDNIRDVSILEAVNSPFFEAIRREFPYNDIANLKRPCMIIDNPQVLRKVIDEHLIPQGHRHSEDIIRDPEVVNWIDRYAEKFKNLTDPVWLELIEDPNYRWYKHGNEYKELFSPHEGSRGSSRDSEKAKQRRGDAGKPVLVGSASGS
jgi:MoaA/NifB/PqqE/SkfB family radical SAM enzyme